MIKTASSILAGLILVLGQALAGSPDKSFDRNAGRIQSRTGFGAIDGHTHDLVPRGGKQPRQSEIERAVAAGLRGAVLAFPLETTTPAGLLRQIRSDMEAVQGYSARKAVETVFVDRFDFSSDGERSRAFQILPSLEYFDGVFGGDLGVLDDLKAAGIRSVTLIDFPGDRLSEGQGGDLRLSAFGQRVVGRMNEMGMAIDISHLPEPLQRDVIRTSRRPVIASHSNARAVAPVGRNLSDEVLTEMTERGGLVLLTFDREFLFGDNRDPSSAGIPRLLKHIAHVVRLCGLEHVGIGTDFGGSGENAPADLGGAECFASIAAGLAADGYPAEAVGKIMSENIAAFYSARKESTLEKETMAQEGIVSFADFRTLKGPYFGQKLPGRIPQVFAPGYVSSDKRELNSVFTPDGREFYFSLQIPGRGYRMYFIRREDLGWSPPRPVPFGSEASDVDMCLTADGRRMYFGSNRPVGGKAGGDFKIWYVDRIGGGWSEARYLEGPVNEGKRALYPTVSRTGTMYFQGIRPDSLGDRDIYRALLSDGEYQEPERLDEAVNSVRGEGDVLIAPDESWMIVSCVDRADGLGAGDLYVSFRNIDGGWTKLRNMGLPVNSEANEYCPMLSPDGRYLFFTSTRTGNGDIYWVDADIIADLRERGFFFNESHPSTNPYLGQKPPGLVPELFAPGIVTTGQSEGCSGWAEDGDGFLFQRWIDRKSVLFQMRRENGAWAQAEKIAWTERYQVGDFTVAPGGRTLAVVSNIPIEGLGSVGEGGNIWIAEWTTSGWSEPRPAGFGINTEFHDSYPSLSASGNLYFFSRRPGGYGQSDLYVARLANGLFLPPENLGGKLNTEAHEWDPYIAPDESYLIFNSMKPGGLGGDDFYISWRTASGEWGEPVHLGREINSAKSDNRPYVTADGKYFFFTSDRRGNRDIFWVDARILETFRPRKTSAKKNSF